MNEPERFLSWLAGRQIVLAEAGVQWCETGDHAENEKRLTSGRPVASAPYQTLEKLRDYQVRDLLRKYEQWLQSSRDDAAVAGCSASLPEKASARTA